MATHLGFRSLARSHTKKLLHNLGVLVGRILLQPDQQLPVYYTEHN